MRDSNRSSRDRERERDRRDRERDRERDRDRDRDKHRDRDRERERRREERSSDYKSSSSKSKKSKRPAKKSRKRSRSSSSYSSRSRSRDSRSSSYKSSRTKKSSTRAPSSESNSRASLITTSAGARATSKPKEIDLTDCKVQKVLETIEDEEGFVPKTFYSTRDREAPEKKPASDKVIIDLSNETVTVPKSDATPMDVEEKEQIFHPNFIGDSELKAEKWIRKLFNYRQRYFAE